eukprot:TRINITY_DN4297_c0_g1_i2.p1 TRINITY_DN4297_c0_g1~~TRINITY_DN4297_c0_g1_i2.p1  ORF type:complete len:697 (+),score=72.58 TRINITY_DN4297_c0_g1_i2:75-2165(+)
MNSILGEILKRIALQHKLLTSSAFLAGLLVVTIFPSFDRRIEVEEHGLIPGYAQSGFTGHWPDRLWDYVNKIEAETDNQRALDNALKQAGLAAYHMNFTTAGGEQSSLTYTLAQSRRGDSRESLVLVVSTNWTSSSPTARSSWGLAVGVVIAQYLRTVHWLSKDVFVVFVDGSLPYGAGARAWLRAYFEGNTAVRRGTLRQAVVLQTRSGVSSLLIDVEGVNGMVPNQDIVNSYTYSTRNMHDQPMLHVHHRKAWDSVFHHFRNGGVHSSHAPFLEYQVPSFTVRGVKPKKNKASQIQPEAIVMSLEGLVRCLSNNLQQLHHSFNFYFFTGPHSHISSGLYLYPVFAMQLPLISFLMTGPAYRDIQSLLVGLGAISVMMLVSGSVVFLLATKTELWERLPLDLPGPPTCVRSQGIDDSEKRLAAASWLTSGLAASLLVSLALRRYAWSVFTDISEGDSAKGRAEEPKTGGVRLPLPLWESVRAASGFAFLAVLAPVTISSWSVALPLTVVSVPVLVLARPFSLTKRPIRSLVLFGFLAGNAFLLAAPPALRGDLLGDLPKQVMASFLQFYYRTLLPAVPPEARQYLPTPLVQWLQEGQLGEALSSDLLVGLYEAARDFRCVGGMLFPTFCFAYWPLLMLLTLIGGILPAQHVEEEGLSWSQLRLGVFLFLSLITTAVVGGVVWKSYSSHGLGELQW